MGKLRGYLSVLGGFLTLIAIAEALARWLGTDVGLTLLGVMLCASGLLSVALALQKRKLWRQLLQMPAHERKALELVSEEARHAFPKVGIAKVRNTVLAGQVAVNGPILPLMLAPISIMQTWFTPEPPIPQFIALGAGFAAAWLWWSVAASYWRKWALARGMSSAEIQYHGEAANLLGPRRR